MTSNDNRQFVTVEMFNSAHDIIQKRFDIIDGKFISLDKTLTVIGYELRFNARDNEHVQTSVYWGFAILGVLIAFFGMLATLAPLLREIYKDSRQAKNSDNFKKIAREVMHEEISDAVAQAVNKALGTFGK